MPCFPPMRVQLCDDLGNLHSFAVQSLRNAVFKSHGDVSASLSGAFSGVTPNTSMLSIVRLIGRILQLQTFVADVPEVPVTAVAVAVIEGKVDAVFLAVFDLVFTGLHCPDVGHTPGSDDLQIRSQGFDRPVQNGSGRFLYR